MLRAWGSQMTLQSWPKCLAQASITSLYKIDSKMDCLKEALLNSLSKHGLLLMIVFPEGVAASQISTKRTVFVCRPECLGELVMLICKAFTAFQPRVESAGRHSQLACPSSKNVRGRSTNSWVWTFGRCLASD